MNKYTIPHSVPQKCGRTRKRPITSKIQGKTLKLFVCNTMPQELNPNKTNTCDSKKITLSNKEILCSWPKCQRIFFSLQNLEKHVKVHTKGLHECNYCSRQFQCKSKLHRHIRIHTGKKPYTCNFCRKCFSRLDYLQSHMRIHTGEKPHTCSLCSKSFSTSSSLTNHTRTHTKEKPYNCKFCAQSFAYLSSLAVHQRIHNGHKPYNCQICEKSFAQSNNLVAHQRVHNRDKPFKCTFCAKSYSQHWSLKIHIIIHTGERPYNCTICSKSFSRKDRLQLHMRKHTDKISRTCSTGRKCSISNTKKGLRKVEKSEEQNQPNNCKQQAKPLHKEDLKSYNDKISMRGTTTTKINQAEKQTKSKEQTRQRSSLTCQVCHQVFSSLPNLCRHYSLQHNLPKVVMENLVVNS